MSRKSLGMISGKVRVADQANLDPNRFDFLDISNAEPNPGAPPENNGILASETDGSRKWLTVDAGLSVSSSNELFVDENTLEIDTTYLDFSDSNVLSDVLADFDQNITESTVDKLESVVSDSTLTGEGTQQDPLAVEYGSINIVKRGEINVTVGLTNILASYLRTDEAFRNNNPKIFNRADEQVALT